jgi:gluconolactonase
VGEKSQAPKAATVEERMSHKVIDSRFLELIGEHEPVSKLGGGFVFTEGPIWHPVEKHLLFSDMPGDVRRKWTPDGGVTEVMRPSNKGNGMTYDADLNLLVCEHATSSVARFRCDGAREVLCSHFEGKELNSPNDICVKSDGTIYFTDPTYGRMPHYGVERPLQQGFQGVYMLRPGHRPGDEPVLVSDRYMFSQPNGLCLSTCERFLWVNDTEQANIRLFDIEPDGKLGNPRIMAGGIKDALRPGVPDGMKNDVHGHIYVTAPGGVWVYDPKGIKLGEIECPEKVANLHWVGDDWQTLFLCATTSLYSVRMRVCGRREPFMRAGDAQPQAASSVAASSSALHIEPRRTALIIQDMQNDVIMEGGAFAGSGSPIHAKEQKIIENSRQLADICRRRGVLVIHVWFVCEPGHPAMLQNAPLFQGVKSANALVRGTWGARPVSGLEPQGGDLIVEKMTMSAWESGRLATYLRGAGIDTLINTGAWTNMSVEHTARTAADKGYRVFVPEDACSTMNADWHKASINYALQNVATVTNVRDVIAALG